MTSLTYRIALLSGFVSCLFFIRIIAPPVDPNKPAAEASAGDGDAAFADLPYQRYLREVVEVLENDTDFRAKLEKADPADVKSGKIAEELDFLHHDVRSKLHEIKRQEIDRIRQALRGQMERDSGIHTGHLDHDIDTFEKEDLKKLIIKTTRDLEELDEKRRKEYKEYEMEKELEFRQQLTNMTEEERQNATKQREAALKRHSEHPDLKHPGSKAQLEEVWEKVDQLPKDSFDPKTFFNLHDLTGDGVLDIAELEALFQKELDKVYEKNNSDDDMRQRDEEMARMREHVMREVDFNKDGLISLEEFMASVEQPDSKDDGGWDTLDKKKVYTEEDLKAFAEQWAKAHGVPVQSLYPYGDGGYAPPYQQYPGAYPPQQPYYGQHMPQQYPPYPQQASVPPQAPYGQGQPPYPGAGIPQQQMGQGQAQFQQPHLQGQPPQFQQQQAVNQQAAPQWQQQQQQQAAVGQGQGQQPPVAGRAQFQQAVPQQQQRPVDQASLSGQAPPGSAPVQAPAL